MTKVQNPGDHRANEPHIDEIIEIYVLGTKRVERLMLAIGQVQPEA